MTRPWTAEERALVERQVDVIYGIFLDRVVEGRELPRAEVEPVAGGRVWTGRRRWTAAWSTSLGGLDDGRGRWPGSGPGSSPGPSVEVRRFGGLERLRLRTWRHSPATSRSLRRAAAALLPELRTAALLLELGPVLALPGGVGGPGPAPEARLGPVGARRLEGFACRIPFLLWILPSLPASDFEVEAEG